MKKRRVSPIVTGAIITAVAIIIAAAITVVSQRLPEKTPPVQQKTEKSLGPIQAEKDINKKTETNKIPITYPEAIPPKVPANKPTEIMEREKQKIEKSLGFTQPEQDISKKVIPNKTIPPSPEVAMKKPGEIDEKEERFNELKGLISTGVTTHSGKHNVALVIESQKTESGVSPENALYNLLRSEKVNIILNYFKEETFKSKGFFKEIYNGNTELLTQANALSKIDYLILGRLNYSFAKRGEENLISCDINFSYKVVGKKGDIVKYDIISIIGPGFSKDAALERGLEMLAEKYTDRIFGSGL